MACLMYIRRMRGSQDKKMRVSIAESSNVLLLMKKTPRTKARGTEVVKMISNTSVKSFRTEEGTADTAGGVRY